MLRMIEPLPKECKEEIEVIGREIAWYEIEATKSIRLALQYKLEIGRRLQRAKALLPRGQFLRWAEHEFGWAPRHVQNHLVLAANAKCVSHLPPEATWRMALAAIKASQPTAVRADANVEAFSSGRREIQAGPVGSERLVNELTRIAVDLGAQKARCKRQGSAHLAELRAILEPAIAALAATRANPALREAVANMDKSMDDPDSFIEAMISIFDPRKSHVDRITDRSTLR
jgi:hypothetical protein